MELLGELGVDLEMTFPIILSLCDGRFLVEESAVAIGYVCSLFFQIELEVTTDGKFQ